jgi:ABC-type transport system substrate-binding protein
MVTPSFSFAPSTFVAVQGGSITFTVYGLESNGVATIYFGDGQEANTTSTVTHTYQDSGRYLVGAEESVNGQSVASTFNALQIIQVTAQMSASLAPSISIPTVAFDVDRNPGAPAVQVGDQVYLYGGFLQPPSGTNMSIIRYEWDFGNGVTRSVGVNETSLNPLENPITATYAQPGLYAVALTVVTENSTSMASFRTSVEQTVAVGSSSQPYALFLYAGVVPNPTVINMAYNWPPPSGLDPALDWDTGWDVDIQILSTLLFYNGSSPTNFIPMAASEVPSVSNAGISPDYTSYTFHIRQGLSFSNGDPVTAYDVYYSIVRSLLLSGSLGSCDCGNGDFVIAQYLVGVTLGAPSIVANATDTADYNSIINSMAYSNSSNTITFKLIRPVIPTLFFQAVAYALGTGILDSAWLERIGAGITFTPAGFYAYQNQGNLGNFNLEVQNDPVSSGPYMIQSYVPGQSISLAPNPGFPGIPGNPGIPKANDTIVVQWVKEQETSLRLFRSGQADFTNHPAPASFPLIKQLAANGQAKIYQLPTAGAAAIAYGNEWGPSAYNETDMKTYFGSQYHCPTDYFLNLDVRKAWAYAFNYNYFLDEILGNRKYGIEFGFGYAGGNLQGVPYSVPESEFQNVPVYNLTYAKQLMQESGEYNTSIDIPYPIAPCYNCKFIDNQTELAMAQMWAAALHSMDPNIVLTPTTLNPSAPGDAYQIGDFLYSVDYPYPSDIAQMLFQDPYAPGWLNSTGHPDQAAMWGQMNALISEAGSATNATLAAQDYKQMEQIAINLYFYIYLYQMNEFYVVKPYLNPYQGQISLFMNPTDYNFYDWWVKTCGSTQACSGRTIGA